MRNLGLLLLLITAISCQGSGEEAGVSRGLAYIGSLPAKWGGSFPKKVVLGETFEENEKDAIDRAAVAWSDSVDRAVDFFDTSSTGTNQVYQNVDSYLGDGTMGIYKLTTWPKSLSGGALAVTQLKGRIQNYGKYNEYVELTHADILVNYDGFDFKPAKTNGYDLQTVVLHEMGHFIGLYHEGGSTEDSVMYPSIEHGEINHTPRELDIQNIREKYSIGAIIPQAARPKMAAALKMPEDSSSEGPEVSLTLELSANGNCKHYLNGELIHEH